MHVSIVEVPVVDDSILSFPEMGVIFAVTPRFESSNPAFF